MNFNYAMPLKWYGCRTRKRWRHWKRQLRRRGINPDYYCAPLRMSFIVNYDVVVVGAPPKDWTLPIIHKRSV